MLVQSGCAALPDCRGTFTFTAQEFKCQHKAPNWGQGKKWKEQRKKDRQTFFFLMAVKYYQIVAVSWTSVCIESQGKQLWVASYTPCSSDNLITGNCLGNFTAHLPQTQESCIVWIDPDIQALISSKVALQTWVTFSRLVSFNPCRVFQATSSKEGRSLSPYLPLGGALKALLWWEGHQLELPLGTCASSKEHCSEAHAAPLRTGPFPCRRSPRARGVWFTGNSSARPDASKLERLWYFITRGNATIQEDEMSKG